jgi:hypothetical protein
MCASKIVCVQAKQDGIPPFCNVSYSTLPFSAMSVITLGFSSSLLNTSHRGQYGLFQFPPLFASIGVRVDLPKDEEHVAGIR